MIRHFHHRSFLLQSLQQGVAFLADAPKMFLPEVDEVVMAFEFVEFRIYLIKIATSDVCVPLVRNTFFYTLEEIIEILLQGVTRMTVTRYIKSGKLKCFKLGNRLVRITQEMLDEYIANNVRV